MSGTRPTEIMGIDPNFVVSKLPTKFLAKKSKYQESSVLRLTIFVKVSP
ncbi:hypothetical protein GUT184_19170 [Streptococcus ruminantium]|nr:hypothetical protein GUT184_19170 [Streptococcus ruminantium]BDD43584.1 hypothetical protein GUT189_19170 [Streptococcus ruminantium]